MRYTGRKGWQASYQDTFDLDCALSPIIYTALVKFRDQMDKEWFGVPSKVIDYCGYTIGETTDDELKECADEEAYYTAKDEGLKLFGEFYNCLWW